MAHGEPDNNSAYRYKTLLRRAHALYTTSVEKSTQTTYKTAEKIWVDVAKAIGTDPYMKHKNPAWLAGDMIFAHTSITWEETCVLAFLAATREPPNTLTPKTAMNYLSAVRKFLQNGGVDTTFMDNSQYIRNTKAAMKIAYRVHTGITDKDTLRLPISIDMILGHNKRVRMGAYTTVDLAVYTAEILAYTTLSRVSEYLYTGIHGTHTLMSTDIIFEMSDGTLVPATSIKTLPFTEVSGCLINIRSAKNDKTGRGHRYYFERSKTGDASLYCIVWTLWRYSQHTHPAAGCPFFHIPAINWTLKPPYLNKRLRDMAIMYGLDPTRVSSHSLRIGGATAMAAAGMHEYEIKQMGGWKSDVFLEYARNTTQMFARSRTALARRNEYTVQSTRRLHPGHNPAPKPRQ